MRPLRILHIVRNLHDGGMERVVADLARASDPDEFETHIMALGGFGRFADAAGLQTRLHRAPPMTRLSLLRPMALAADIAAIAPDVVHTHSGSWYKVARAAALARVPLVYTEHGRTHPDPWMHRFLDRRAARLTARVVAVSRALADYLVTTLRIPRSRVHCILNGIDLERMAPAPPPSSDVVVFGTLGRIEPVKGYDVLLAALAQWPADAPAVRLLIGGEGSQRSALERLAARLGLGDRVRFVGWVDDTPKFCADLDVFVLSSHSEGTSLSLLEAMAVGRPAVVTDVGGNADILGPELRDWMVPAGDPGRLAAAMARLARLPALRRELGDRARGRIAAAFDLRAVARRYAAVYRTVARRARAARAALKGAAA